MRAVLHRTLGAKSRSNISDTPLTRLDSSRLRADAKAPALGFALSLAIAAAATLGAIGMGLRKRLTD